jgi:hypothetical protein
MHFLEFLLELILILIKPKNGNNSESYFKNNKTFGEDLNIILNMLNEFKL